MGQSAIRNVCRSAMKLIYAANGLFGNRIVLAHL